MLKPHLISKFLIKNIRKHGNPIGVPVNTWFHGLKVEKHRRILVTGLMYQIAPYISKITDLTAKIEGSAKESILSLATRLPTYLIVKPEKEDVKRFNKILVNIYLLLKNSGVDFGYDPNLDFYSGILLHDLGLDEEFEKYVTSISDKLRSEGIREIITVDPHTTYALSKLYPEEFKVKSYLELIDVRGLKGKVTIHDPCYYARYLDFYERPREVLRKAGIECSEVRNSKKMTYCCGAPIESVSPKLSLEIAKIRYSELRGERIVTMCPLCLARLKKFGEVYDIAEILSGG